MDKVANAISLATAFEGVAESGLQVGRGIEALKKTQAPKLSGKALMKIFTVISLPFTFLSGLVSLYFMAEDGAALKNAYRTKDFESGKDRSLSLTSNTANVADAGLGGTVGVLKLKGAGSSAAANKAAMLSPVAAGLSLAVFAIYTTIQVIAISRVQRALNKMIKFFELPSQDEKGTRNLEKYQDAMDQFYTFVGITREEELEIMRSTDDYIYGEAFFKEVDRVTAKKHLKLERRVGQEVALIIKENAQRLKQGLQSEDLAVRKKALMESEVIFKRYKAALYKKITIHSIGILAGVIGMVAAAVALANPVGALLAGGLLIGSACGLLIYAWYGGVNWKESAFESGLKVLGKTISNFEIPNAHEICKEEEAYDQKKSKAKLIKSLELKRKTSFDKQSDLSRIYDLMAIIQRIDKEVSDLKPSTACEGG